MTESWQTLTANAESAARGGRYAEAKDCYRQALQDATDRQDPLNAYYSQCALAGLLRLLDEFGECEQLLKEALQLRWQFSDKLAREPVSPFNDLERLLVKQNRLQELENALTNDTQQMMQKHGRDSFEYKMSLMNLARAYGQHIKDMDKCRLMFAEVVEWSKTAEPITRKMVYTTYDGVLRAAGLTAEADAAQAELAELKKQSPA
ncbi:MAG: hypothetical protein IT343_10855 [Candidatus Melainabacteria bacterium]|jgi:tetratricopeptide (TPR) repeat protein|nr:hypothetical protein [Candidatus Melainabacteria bacterium]